ncbi:MAG: DedA family protein [Verrucomicrobia bacterium]|nr:DedA family protein [Verrucomicrobiota bacterium]
MLPEEPDDSRKETKRLLIVVLVVSGLIAALHFTPLKQWLVEAQNLKARVSEYGWRADAVFVFGSMAGIALGLPRLGLCALGGLLFGFVEGFLLSQFAGVLGAYGTFLITRSWGPKKWVQRKLANSQRLRAILGKPSVGTIFVARQMPVPGIVPNVLLGVLNTGHWTFLIGTFIGYLPSNIPVALAGSSMAKESLAKAITQVSSSMLALGIFSSLIIWVRRKVKSEVREPVADGG